jgi:uncharacterized protein (TIRG00374 family)
MPSSPSSGRVPWHALFIAGLTLGLLWLFLRNIDPRQAWDALTHAHAGWITLAIVVALQTYVLRAWRWQVLLAPIGPARFRTVFRTTVIGFAASALLPGRVGEVLKPYLLARHEGLNVASTIATVIVERLLDLITVLLLFGLGILVAGVDVGAEVRAAGLVAGAGSLVGFVLLVVLAGHPERLGRWASYLGRWLPARFSDSLGHLVRTFAEGFKVMRSPSHLFWGCVWSVPLWLSIALGIWLTSLAFDLTLSFVASFLVMGYLTVGVSLPTPGGAGGFHYFYKAAMTQLFGAPESVAAAAAIVLHLVSFVPVTMLGLVYMWQDGLTLGGLRRLKQQASTESAGG